MAKQPYLREGLLAPGLIRLFGRKFKGLKLCEEGMDPTSNNPLVLQSHIDHLTERLEALERRTAPEPAAPPPASAPAAAAPPAAAPPAATPPADAPPGAASPAAAPPAPTCCDEADDCDDDPKVSQDGKARLARIYGFSYLGHYYKIANPPVLRVYGQGFPVLPGWLPENHMDILGVEFKHADFVRGIRMWPIDQRDVIVRIDITIGWVRELLLDPEMSKETNVTDASGGGRADVVGRDSGLVGRDSGLIGRDSGLVGRDSGFVGRSRNR